MGEYMKEKYKSIINHIVPYKKSTIFFITIIIIGVTLGAIYAININQNDKLLVIDRIKEIINSINNNDMKYNIIFKNSILNNLTYISLISLLGLTLVGSFISIIILLFKSFTIGFSISAFILTYKVKGLILSVLYLILSQFLTLISILLLSIYSFMFSVSFIKTILIKNSNQITFKRYLKKYSIIILLTLCTSLISALSETYLLPAIIKLIIKLYI